MSWQLAQINLARLLYPEGDPRVAGFFVALDEVNALAEASDGFVWRLQDEAGNATGIRVAPDPLLIVNLSVWRDRDSLAAFAYRSDHAKVLARRGEWFAPHEGASLALWWVEAGHRPSPAEGMARLRYLERHGPGRHAFTFRKFFAVPERLAS